MMTDDEVEKLIAAGDDSGGESHLNLCPINYLRRALGAAGTPPP